MQTSRRCRCVYGRAVLGAFLVLIASNAHAASGPLGQKSGGDKPATTTPDTNKADQSALANREHADKTGNNQQSAPRPQITVTVDHKSDEGDRSQIARWLQTIVGWILSWPFVALLLLLYLLFARGAPARLENLFKPFDSLKLFGQEFVLTRRGGENAEAGIVLIRTEIENQLFQEIQRFGIVGKHQELLTQTLGAKVQSSSDLGVRSTIYVHDRLFDETLYQLLDYYPPQAIPGHGRTYSARYGIIGKTWRLEESQYDPCVPVQERTLILEWGMTKDEATIAAHGRQSFACIAFKNPKDNLIALLYLDSPKPKAFGDSDQSPEWRVLEAQVQTAANNLGLLSGLKSIHARTLSMGPRIHIRRSETSSK